VRANLIYTDRCSGPAWRPRLKATDALPQSAETGRVLSRPRERVCAAQQTCAGDLWQVLCRVELPTDRLFSAWDEK
jgi:hypothetical protein